MADAYGLNGVKRGVLVDSVLEQQARNARFWAEVSAGSKALVSANVVEERIARSRRELAFTYAHRAVFEQALA
ncbi:hypothetical protein ACFXOD_33915 [Streptomyces sp. NPDC059161]|uniref:hypothetical protein n=1 Tax=Streptomyces sp. NPDC059161 TaxID=3346749 RepID=UPI0036AF025E